MTIANRVYPIIQSVRGDERAFWLTELLYQSPKYRGFHRYQIIYVQRNGRLCEFHTDMGIESKWKGTKLLSIPSFFEHTIDELKELANEERSEKDRIDFMDLLQLDKVNLA